jgi:hypothetical protein
MTKVVFGGGVELETTADPQGIIELLGAIANGQRGNDRGQPLPSGYAAIHTADGPVYVNASQVAYVRE